MHLDFPLYITVFSEFPLPLYKIKQQQSEWPTK